MAKVYPCTPTAASSSSFPERKTFTIWMKSLVLNGNGCTVFDSNGEIVYRIDNYDSKCGSEVFLMDLRGRVLCSILRKRFWVFGCWKGYRGSSCHLKNEKPWFQVCRNYKILWGNSACKVAVKCTRARTTGYKIEGLAGKSALKIVDSDGGLVAEVKRKQSCSGVVLGDDVLTLAVEPRVDHTLVISLIAVHGLINHRM